MPDKIGRALTARPTFERNITRTISPEGIAAAPGAEQIEAPNIGPGGEVLPGTNTQQLSLGAGGIIAPPPEETRVERVQVKGAPFSLTVLSDFLSGVGDPRIALEQQRRRSQGVNQIFGQEQANADLLLQRQRQGFQRDFGLRRLGISERDISLREQTAARPKISTFQSRDGSRLFTVNAETGELVSSMNLSEPLSPQVVADFISNFENALGSPLNPNEQAILSNAGQSALQQEDLGIVASALDGIASGREGFRRQRTLSRIVTDRQVVAAERKGEIEQRKNDRVALQAERQAILKENSAIRKQINTLRRDLFRGDIRSRQKDQLKIEIKRLDGALVFNESQIRDLDKQILQLSGKKSLLRKRGTEEQPKKTLRRITPTQPGTAAEFIRTESGKP